MNKEIERKFLVAQIPTETPLRTENILQTYIVGEDNPIRLRNIDSKHYFITVKSGEGISREEDEVEVPYPIYQNLLPLTSKRLTKNRITYENGMVLDVFHQSMNNKTLLIAEREFNSIEEALEFQPPAWCGRNVTEDGTYNCFNLAKRYNPRDPL